MSRGTSSVPFSAAKLCGRSLPKAVSILRDGLRRLSVEDFENRHPDDINYPRSLLISILSIVRDIIPIVKRSFPNGRMVPVGSPSIWICCVSTARRTTVGATPDNGGRWRRCPKCGFVLDSRDDPGSKTSSDNPAVGYTPRIKRY